MNPNLLIIRRLGGFILLNWRLDQRKKLFYDYSLEKSGTF